MVESEDADQKPCFAASDLGLHCLLRPVCSAKTHEDIPVVSL